VPGPLPRLLLWCIYPFLPTRLRPSPPLDWVGAWQFPVQRLLYGALFRGCSHSLRFRPAGLLATPVAPTAVLLLPVGSWPARFLPVSRRVPQSVEPWTPSSSGQPWLFHLNNSWFVTSPSPRYASRPNRAIDDRGLSPHKIHSLVGCPLTVELRRSARFALAPSLINCLLERNRRCYPALPGAVVPSDLVRPVRPKPE
jgi:hypothetical protein